VVTRTLEVGNTRVARVVDVGEDGRDEVLFVQGFYRGGMGSTSGKLDRIDATRLVALHDFGEALSTDCGGRSTATADGVICQATTARTR